MNEAKHFWDAIADSIQEKLGNGHPKTWNKHRITSFLEDFSKTLEAICSQDAQKAKRCGVLEIRPGETERPGITYHSFRRLFITRESSGNRTTREMFAIYLGYDSAYDFMTQKGIRTTLEPAEGSKPRTWKRTHLWLAIIGVLSILIFWGFWSRPTEASYAFVKNELGITLINLRNERQVQLIPYTEDVAGLDFDPSTRTLYWACPNLDYQSIGCVRLNSKLTEVEIESLNRHLTPKMEGPVGIALDTKNQWIYCSDYKDSLILKFNYQGELLDSMLTGKLPGAPSSIELDVKKQVLYWTDINNDRIGRLDLKSKKLEPDFIINAGRFPDGMSLDTLNERLYWGSKTAGIGWADLSDSKPIAHLVKTNNVTEAVEIDAERNILYYGFWEKAFLGKVSVEQLSNSKKISSKNELFAGAGHPGVIKIFKFKRS